MPGKTKVILLLSAFLVTMCRTYAHDAITYHNGLSCQNYVEYRLFADGDDSGLYARSEGADCTYTCPGGSVEEVRITGSVSSIYAASSEDLEAQLCGIDAPPGTAPASTASPTMTAEVASTALSPTPTPTATVVVISDPLLSERVSMCDLGGKLINFRINAPAPDLTGKLLEVEIADQLSTCYVNPTNPALLTCSIPNDIRFPAHVVVRLDGVVVNDFMYSGVGCAILTTPTPSKIRSYP